MVLDAFSLKDKLALITGGGTGIGLGIAKAFINAGARVVITGRRQEVLENAVAILGVNSAYIQNDISDRKLIPALVHQIEEQYGPVDILVNNAGEAPQKMGSGYH